MMQWRNILLIGFGSLVSDRVVAQPWIEGVGGGVGLQGITSFYVDSSGGNLLMSGFFTYANGLAVSPGIIHWDGTSFTSYGCGVEWDCVQTLSEAGSPVPTLAIAKWRGDVYLGGVISFDRDGHSYRGMMRWNGDEWLPVGSLDSKVTSIHVINDQLVVTGWFQYADTVLANGLARWDGEQWHRVVDVPQFDPGSFNYINDVAFYDGQWYLGGNLLPFGDLVRYNGSTWEPIGAGIQGTFSIVETLKVHDNKLYVGGSFGVCPPYGVPSNPGSGLVAWDGLEWNDLGGGTCESVLPDVNDFIWWNGDLYAVGRFNTIGGVPCGKMAVWNGEDWCALLPEGYFPNGGPSSIAVYNDSLFIGGSFLEDADPPISCFAKWVGGEQHFGCGTLASLNDDAIGFEEWVVYPNPTADYLNLGELPEGSRSIVLLDALGRLIYSGTVANKVDLRGVSSGLYTLAALSFHGIVIGRVQVLVK